jgi:hypothetical protein
LELSQEERKKIYLEEKARAEREVARPDNRPSRGHSPGESSTREQRITASSLAIVWYLALLVLFFFFRQYIAYYQLEQVSGVVKWAKYSVLTGDFNRWLVILTTTAVVAIICHIVIIVYDRYLLREGVIIGLSLLGIITLLALIFIFPFDFSIVPDADREILSISLKAAIGGAIAIASLVTLIRFIKLLIRIFTRTAFY